MSRLVKKPIIITTGVTVKETNGILNVKGPKGELNVPVVPGSTVKIDGDKLWIDAGTMWSLSRNAIEGVTNGFLKVLEIEGVGYRVVVEGKEIVLYLGYALPVRKPIPAGITITVEKNVIKIAGIDKDQVGRAAAEIRSLKKPEPYKGKGIRYQGEIIQRKVGKKAGTGTTA